MSAYEALRVAVDILWPLIRDTADYLAGRRDTLPELPATLKSRVELERAKARRKKA